MDDKIPEQDEEFPGGSVLGTYLSALAVGADVISDCTGSVL